MVEQGLPHNIVNRLAQDDRGYLWLATGAGLARFDSATFQEFSVPNRPLASAGNVRDVVAGPEGRLLVLPASGGVWTLRDGVFEPHPITAAFSGQTLLDVYAEPGGAVWVAAAPSELVRWENGTVRRYGAAEGFSRRVNRVSFATDGDGRTWVASAEFLRVFERGEPIAAQPLPDGAVSGALVAPARSGGVWISSSDRLMKWDRGQLTVVCGGTDWPARRSGVEALFEDRQGNLWIGSRRHGIFLLFNGRVSNLAFEPRTVTSILEDREGNLWAATTTDGLARLRPQTYTQLDLQSGLAETMSSSVCEDSTGVIWCANRSGGLARYRDGRIEKVNTATRLDRYATRVAPDAQGNVWAASDTGLFRFPAGHPEQCRPTEPSFPAVQILFASRRGDMWVVSANGLGFFRDDQYHVVAPASAEVARYNAIAEDSRGSLWIAANNMRAAEARIRLLEYRDGELRESIPPQAWPAGPILSLRVDRQDRLWIGTTAGLVLKDGDRQVRFSKAEGLPDDIVAEQLEDDGGNLWIASRRGFFQVNENALLDVAERRATKVLPTVVGADDGLQGASGLALGQPRCWKGRDGRLWFTTHRGIVGLDPKRSVPGGTPPPVYLESVAFDGRSQPLKSGTLRVEPETRRITFRFAVLNYSAPEQIHVRHRLEGYDVDWIDADAERSATYSRLPPGNYLLRVIAANQAGVWNEQGATLAVVVAAAWWQTKGFLAAAILAVGALVAWVARTIAVRKMRRRLEVLEREHALERERARIARNLHDELGGSLTQIGLLAERVKRHAGPEMDKPLSQLAWRTRSLAGDLESIVWTISPQNNSWDRLASFAAQFARRFFKDTPIRCTVDGVESIPARPLGPDEQHEVLAVLKEALNNVLKHSRAGSVAISVQLGGDAFELRVSDDGIGFDPSAKEHAERNGLSNMKARAESLGGVTEVTSRPGEGTTVRLRLPLEPAGRAPSNGSAPPI